MKVKDLIEELKKQDPEKEVMLENKIKLVKQEIGQLADKHEYYMGISVGSGSKATEIIEERQSKLFELLDRLQGNIV